MRAGVAADPVQEFRGAMAAAGVVTRAPIVPDGRMHRVHVEGDRGRDRNGWYVLHGDDRPAGAFGCWKRGFSGTWSAEADTTYTPADRAAWERTRKAREAEQRALHQRTAEKAERLWDAARPADPEHPYLQSKGIRPYGIRQSGTRLLVPVRDGGAALHGLQFISPDGTKLFLTGTAKQGHYHSFGRPDGTVAICEGLATAATVREATGFAVVVAFDAGNLLPVAENIRAKLPHIRIVIAADNDRATEGNPGLTAARKAASAVGGVVAVPRFADGERGTDWNDYAALHGLEAVAAEIEAATAPPTPAASAPEFCMGEHLTDMGNARRLVALNGADLRYVPAWGAWLVWDGMRWTRDETGEVERRAKETARSIYAEANATEDSDKRQTIGKHAVKSESERAVRAMIALAKTEPGIPVKTAELDADPWLLNVLNGTLDLRTGELRPHRREDLITKLAPVAYDADAKCPTWIAFLDRIMGSRVDLVGFIQRLTGYTLTGQTTEQILALLYGTGANGKSTLLELIAEMMGDYGQSIEFSTLLARGQDSTRNDLARLVGARFVAGSEVEDGRRFSEVLVKQLTGGDKITARFLFKEYFDFWPQFKLWLAANHKPTIRGTDHAIWRRIRLVPCTVTIPEAERDPGLRDKLRAELPGILAWAVRGCLAWQRDGLGVPQVVQDATDEYRDEMDVLGGFLSERCEVGPDCTARAGELYDAYKAWCEAGGEHAKTKNKFATLLSERGFEKTRDRSGTSYLGVALVTTMTTRGDFSGNFSKENSHIERTPISRNTSSQSSHRSALDYLEDDDAAA